MVYNSALKKIEKRREQNNVTLLMILFADLEYFVVNVYELFKHARD